MKAGKRAAEFKQVEKEIKTGSRIRILIDVNPPRIWLAPMTGKYFRTLAIMLKPKRGEQSMLCSQWKRRWRRLRGKREKFLISGKFVNCIKID